MNFIGLASGATHRHYSGLLRIFTTSTHMEFGREMIWGHGLSLSHDFCVVFIWPILLGLSAQERFLHLQFYIYPQRSNIIIMSGWMDAVQLLISASNVPKSLTLELDLLFFSFCGIGFFSKYPKFSNLFANILPLINAGKTGQARIWWLLVC